jgi:hypothetical protein
MIWVLLIFYYTNDGKLVHKEEAGPFKTVEACNDAGKEADAARTSNLTWSCVPRAKK